MRKKMSWFVAAGVVAATGLGAVAYEHNRRTVKCYYGVFPENPPGEVEVVETETPAPQAAPAPAEPAPSNKEQELIVPISVPESVCDYYGVFEPEPLPSASPSSFSSPNVEDREDK